MRLHLPLVALLATSAPAFSDEYSDAMQSYLDQNIVSWLADPTLHAAVDAQNSETASLSQGEIDDMDLQWRAQVGTGNTPLVDTVITNGAAAFLRQQVDVSAGVITEIIVMDARGLNVAASHVTSDYWQGDEAKYQETYPNGVGATHFSEIEFDESSQRYQGQISISLVDPASQEPIGAVTIGVDAEALLSL